MMMNPSMTRDYDVLLRELLDTIPKEIWKVLTENELALLLQGLSELDTRTVLMPAFRETITQYRPIPVEPYRPRVKPQSDPIIDPENIDPNLSPGGYCTP